MNYRRKVYMFKYLAYRDEWKMSKTYVSAYQCQKGAEEFIKNGTPINFYVAELDWKCVEQVYNINTITEG